MKTLILLAINVLILTSCSSTQVQKNSKLYCYDNYSKVQVWKDVRILDYGKNIYYVNHESVKNSFTIDAQSCLFYIVSAF